MEHIDGLHLLTRTNELDRLRHHRTDREGSTTTGVTVEFRQHHELLSGIHGILTSHRIDHEEGLVGMDCILQRLNLIHHLLIDGQTTSGIDDDYIVGLSLGLLNGVVGNLHHVLIVRFRIDGHAYSLSHDLQLLDSSGTIDVAGHQQRLLVMTRLQQVGKLTAERGLTRTLQTRHQDDGRCTRTALDLQFGSLASHQFRQLVVHNLHHQLAGLHGSEHVHTHRLLLHGIRERLCHLVVHVGIKQCTTHVFQGFSYVDLGDLSLTFQYLERSLKSVT